MRSKPALMLADAIEAAVRASPEAQQPDADRLFDTDADALTMTRAMLAQLTREIATMPADSPRLNPARANQQRLVKIIANMEREQAGKETAADGERRRRREDEETLRRIEEYVVQHEAKAARDGVCLWCGQGLP